MSRLNTALEAVAFSETLIATPPDRVTACNGWTAHELLAHLVAGGIEVATIVGAFLENAAIPPTRSFDEREANFRAMDPYVLRKTFLESGSGLTDLLVAMNERSEVATVPFTGWEMNAITMITHVRSELALHRWDLAGDDDLSFELLSQPEFTIHAVRSLNAFAGLQENPTRRARAAELSSDFAVRIRTVDQPDVMATVQDGIGRLELADPVDGPALLMDAAARVLMLWGRRPTQVHDIRSTLKSGELSRLHRWMYGF
jgi:hypothetical protein